ncbi:MAG: hypothetical protein LBQ68_05195 [Clostridiales bacterium]|jgi:hypothetical protein|nr:hypothetical protein [Clostridiales bacterium]
MQEIVKTLLYASTIRSYINVEAIFADETDTYLTPSEPKLGEKITLRLRTARNNVSGVFIHFVQDGLDKTRARSNFPKPCR